MHVAFREGRLDNLSRKNALSSWLHYLYIEAAPAGHNSMEISWSAGVTYQLQQPPVDPFTRCWRKLSTS